MKKTLALIAMLGLGMGMVSAGEDLPIPGKFKEGMKGWIQNSAKWNAPHGKVTTVKLKENENGIRINAVNAKETPVYAQNRYDAKSGEKFKMSADVMGKGTILLGFYLYDAKGGWVTLVAKSVKVDSPAKEMDAEVELVIPESKKKDAAGNIVPITGLRPYFAAAPGTDATFSDIEVERQ